MSFAIQHNSVDWGSVLFEVYSEDSMETNLDIITIHSLNIKSPDTWKGKPKANERRVNKKTTCRDICIWQTNRSHQLDVNWLCHSEKTME